MTEKEGEKPPQREHSPAEGIEMFYELAGTSVDEVMENLAKNADLLHAVLVRRDTEISEGLRRKIPNDPSFRKKDLLQAIVGALNECSRVLYRPPPPELVDLFGYLLDVDPKDPPKQKPRGYWDAAKFIARNPEASDHKVAQAAGVSNHTIRKWRGEVGFRRMIENEKVKARLGSE